jgi:hypothetical protein
MKLPSDLAGVSLQSFKSGRSDGNLLSAMSPACTIIRKTIRELGVSETRIAKRLTSATAIFEGVSSQVERLIYLMARSRVLELDVIHRQFGTILPNEFVAQLIEDLNCLKAETEPDATKARKLGSSS